jgi:hypothetical protein
MNFANVSAIFGIRRALHPVWPDFFQRWFSREPLDEAFVKSVIRGLVGQLKRN